MREREIPQTILALAKDCLGNTLNIKYLGEYQGSDVYYHCIPNAETGFPFVYLLNRKGETDVFTGFEGLSIAGLFIKDREI